MLEFVCKYNTPDGSRTHTGIPLEPKSSASAYSATGAYERNPIGSELSPGVVLLYRF